jgi:hypothetical protein
MKIVQTIRNAWRAAPVATAIFGVAIIVGIVFTVRIALFWGHWADPANRDQNIEPWMTPGYVAHSWYIPREVMLDALPIPLDKGKRRNFDQLSKELGIPVEELIGIAQSAIDDYRALHPAPQQGGKR